MQWTNLYLRNVLRKRKTILLWGSFWILRVISSASTSALSRQEFSTEINHFYLYVTNQKNLIKRFRKKRHISTHFAMFYSTFKRNSILLKHRTLPLFQFIAMKRGPKWKEPTELQTSPWEKSYYGQSGGWAWFHGILC